MGHSDHGILAPKRRRAVKLQPKAENPKISPRIEGSKSRGNASPLPAARGARRTQRSHLYAMMEITRRPTACGAICPDTFRSSLRDTKGDSAQNEALESKCRTQRLQRPRRQTSTLLILIRCDLCVRHLRVSRSCTFRLSYISADKGACSLKRTFQTREHLPSPLRSPLLSYQ